MVRSLVVALPPFPAYQDQEEEAALFPVPPAPIVIVYVTECSDWCGSSSYIHQHLHHQPSICRRLSAPPPPPPATITYSTVRQTKFEGVAKVPDL